MRHPSAFALMASLIASSAVAQDTPALVRYADSVAKAAVAERRTAGVSVAIVKNGETILARGYGFADVENDVPATTETVYRIGSLTKQFTAAAIMRLMEQGRLSLDDTLQKFLPSYDTQGNRVTVRHLLSHTSGIRSYTSMGPRWERTVRNDLVPDSLVAIFAGEPFDFKPGDQWSYSNSGYALLGVIVEKLSGKAYGQYLRDEFFTPLGLEGTVYCDQAPIIKHRAQGYDVEPPDGHFSNASPLSMTQPYAAGALCSTVTDLAAWTRALSGGKVVSPASYRMMSTAGTLNDGRLHTYGFGLSAGALRGHRQVSHNGGINGFTSELHHYVDDSLITVVLTNTGTPTASHLEKLIARRALGVADYPVVPIAAEELQRLAGEYAIGRNRLRFVVDGGRLRAPDFGFSLLYIGGGRFIRDGDDDVVYEFAPGTPAPSYLRTIRGVTATGIRVP